MGQQFRYVHLQGKIIFQTLARAMVLAALLPLTAQARILRDRAEVQAFRHTNPCPSTDLTRGACPGFEVDHVIPLCAGGPDRRENMQWLSWDDHRFKTVVDVRECHRLRLATPMN